MGVSIIQCGLLGLIWIINLFNGTGLDMIYHVTEYSRYIVYALFFMSFILRKGTAQRFRIDHEDFFSFGMMAILFLASSFSQGYGQQSVDYIWAFCIIYLLSKMKINDRVFFCVGLGYGVAGAIVLFIYDYRSFLSGWNPNSIGMIGMYSYLFLLIPMFKRKSWTSKLFVIMATVVFSLLIVPTDSRSGILFMIVGMLFALDMVPRNIVMGSKMRVTIAMMVPLIIAVLIVLVSKSVDMNVLDIWSYAKFGKPLFNGRDELWNQGFLSLFSHPIFGSGRLDYLNWHNSAVACLTTYGILGFYFWIKSFRVILVQGLDYKNDYLVQGCIISFIILFVQQSVELGFISSNPNILPYTMLGMLLARIRYIQVYDQLWYEESQI